MTETLTSAAPVLRTSKGRRLARSVAAVASSGVLVGIGAAGVAPAFAAETTDCVPGNTVTSTGNPADVVAIQTLLDANTAIVCLSGTFVLASPLTFDHDLTIFGLAPATLDGNDVTRMLTGSGQAELIVQNLSFVDGSATTGGAIEVDGELSVENSVFNGNTSTGDGGAIRSNSNESVTIVDSTFRGNEAAGIGGAVLGFAIVTDSSVFSENTASEGGALYGVLVVVSESTFSTNTALNASAGAVRALAYAATFGSTFVDNSAELTGGAIATGFRLQDQSYGGTFGLNSTFVGNTAGVTGGAVFTEYGQIGLSTFLNNEANSDVPAEHSEAIFVDGPEQEMQLGGNIFAGSRNNAQLGAGSASTYNDNGGNVFSTSQSAEVALGTPEASTLFARSVASIFGPNPGLADNGGATETVALFCTSPAIDAVPTSSLVNFGLTSAPALAPVQKLLLSTADFTAVVETTDVDQRNVDRTDLADAGAYENDVCVTLAATGAEPATTGWLVGFAALLLGSGAAVALGSGRRSRTAARISARS